MRVSCVVLVGAALAGAAAGQNDWPTFGHDLAGTRYSTLKQIDPTNVTKLVRAWTYHMAVESAPAPAPPAPGDSAASDASSGRGRERGDAAPGGAPGDARRGGGGRGGRGGGGRNSEVVPLVID